MKAQELRIGNYCHYDGWTFYSKITSKDLAILEKHPDDPKYKPVLLNVEVLLKAGFLNSTTFQGHLSMKKDSYHLVRVPSGLDIWDLIIVGSSVIITTIHTLHHLQNIWHDITGNELEIKL